MKRMSAIEASGFAAIMLALFALFAIPGGILDQHRGGVAVDLVHAKHSVALPNSQREDAIIISVQRDGGLFFGNKKTHLESLPQQIQESVARGAEKRIYLNADKYARYSDVKAVIDAIHESGVEHLSIFANTPPSSQQASGKRN